eukprot:1194340-Prorocentrum_minimum.AAC.1
MRLGRRLFAEASRGGVGVDGPDVPNVVVGAQGGDDDVDEPHHNKRAGGQGGESVFAPQLASAKVSPDVHPDAQAEAAAAGDVVPVVPQIGVDCRDAPRDADAQEHVHRVRACGANNKQSKQESK